LGDPAHKWGESPFHYTKEYYRFVSKKIVELGIDPDNRQTYTGEAEHIRQTTPDLQTCTLGGRQADVSGEFRD
jgi:hypothetical protein